MQRLIALLSRVRERLPFGSASAPFAAGAAELRKNGWGELHKAAASGDLARLQRHWWRKRHRINERDAKQQTPLHLACGNGHTGVVRFLARKKCQLNPHDCFQKSPLVKAVERQHKDCVAILLEHGANPDLKGACGNTALHLAAIIPSKPLVELLLEHNAHIDAQNELGYTPLTVAITEQCEEIVEFLLQKGADVHARDSHERTMLMIAAFGGNMNIVQLLLQHGADLSHEDQFGQTALYYARKSRNDNILHQLEEYLVCEWMGECSAEDTTGPAVLDSSCPRMAAGSPLGAPALTGADALPAAGAEQEEDFGAPSDSKASALEKEELQLKEHASTQGDGDRADRQRWVRQLQQELANALKKTSLAEASLEAKKRHSRDLQKQILQLQKKLDRSKAKLQELKERRIWTECYAESLKDAIKSKERELRSFRNMQDLLAMSSGTATIPELEERVQQLQAGKARLEATAQQQAKTIEALQKGLQASTSAHNGPEALLTGFQTTWTAKEHQHWQPGSEIKEVEKLGEMKCQSEGLLGEMRQRNIALEAEHTRLKMLLEETWRKLMVYEGKKVPAQFPGKT